MNPATSRRETMSNTKTISRDSILDALDAANLYEDALREDYSGRHGATCFGIVYENIGDLLTFAGYLGEQGEVDTCFLGQARSDSMGMSSIVYFPGWTLE